MQQIVDLKLGIIQFKVSDYFGIEVGALEVLTAKTRLRLKEIK